MPYSASQARCRWFEPTCAHQVYAARWPFGNANRRLGNHRREPPAHAPGCGKGALSTFTGRLAGGLPGHRGGVSNEQRGDAGQLVAAADEVEAGRGRSRSAVRSHAGRAGICGAMAAAGGAGVSRGNGVMQPSVLTQVRSRGRGRKALAWMRPGPGSASLICSAMPAPRDRA